MGHYDHLDDDGPELPPEAGNSEHHPFEANDAWLQGAPPELQIEAMRRWFYARYEDPANQTPYSSQEGGYMFVFGGPYDPNDVIQERFDRAVPYKVMEKLIQKTFGARSVTPGRPSSTRALITTTSCRSWWRTAPIRCSSWRAGWLRSTPCSPGKQQRSRPS